MSARNIELRRRRIVFLPAVQDGTPLRRHLMPVDLATADITGTLGVDHGGTGVASVTAGALLYGAGTSPLVELAVGGASTVLVGGGAAPAYSTRPVVEGLEAGPVTVSDDEIGFYLRREFDTGGFSYYEGVERRAYVVGTDNFDHLEGGFYHTGHNSTGTLNYLYGVWNQIVRQTSAGDVVNDAIGIFSGVYTSGNGGDIGRGLGVRGHVHLSGGTGYAMADAVGILGSISNFSSGATFGDVKGFEAQFASLGVDVTGSLYAFYVGASGFDVDAAVDSWAFYNGDTTIRSWIPRLLGTTLVEANTAVAASPNALAAAESGTLLTNEGVAAENYEALPAAAADLSFTFVCQDANGIRVTAAAGDTIRVGDVVSAAGGYIRTTEVGAAIRLTAINATEWVAEATIGEWFVDGATLAGLLPADHVMMRISMRG